MEYRNLSIKKEGVIYNLLYYLFISDSYRDIADEDLFYYYQLYDYIPSHPPIPHTSHAAVTPIATHLAIHLLHVTQSTHSVASHVHSVHVHAP